MFDTLILQFIYRGLIIFSSCWEEFVAVFIFLSIAYWRYMSLFLRSSCIHILICIFNFLFLFGVLAYFFLSMVFCLYRNLDFCELISLFLEIHFDLGVYWIEILKDYFGKQNPADFKRLCVILLILWDFKRLF
jgi:hypothetical protein